MYTCVYIYIHLVVYLFRYCMIHMYVGGATPCSNAPVRNDSRLSAAACARELEGQHSISAKVKEGICHLHVIGSNPNGTATNICDFSPG